MGGFAMKTLRRYLLENWFWLLTNVGAAIPLAWLIWDYWMDNLSINPIQDLTQRTGKAAVLMLTLSLAVTPVNTLTGFKQVIRVRKALGLWAFSYVAIHFLIFLGLDYLFSLRDILKDGLPQKPYIVVGFSA